MLCLQTKKLRDTDYIFILYLQTSIFYTGTRLQQLLIIYIYKKY